MEEPHINRLYVLRFVLAEVMVEIPNLCPLGCPSISQWVLEILHPSLGFFSLNFFLQLGADIELVHIGVTTS